MPDFDQLYMTAWEAVSFVAYGIAADGGEQWREQNKAAYDDVELESMGRLMAANRQIGKAASTGDILVKGHPKHGDFKTIPADDWLKPGSGVRVMDLWEKRDQGVLHMTVGAWYDLRFVREDVLKAFGGLEIDCRSDEPKRTRTPRQHDSTADMLLKNRIKTVLTVAKKQWPNGKPRNIGHGRMAEMLAALHPTDTLGSYSEGSIRRILRGDYPPMARLAINSPFSSG